MNVRGADSRTESAHTANVILWREKKYLSFSEIYTQVIGPKKATGFQKSSKNVSLWIQQGIL